MWFSYRFVEMFPDATKVKSAQLELDKLIQDGVQRLTKILKCLGSLQENNTPVENIPIIAEAIPEKGSESSNTMTGPMTTRVLSEGLLSATMLQQLHDEWKHDFYSKQREILKKSAFKYKYDKDTKNNYKKPKKKF